MSQEVSSHFPLTHHPEGVPVDVILSRVIPGGDEVDFASFYAGEFLTDAAINAAAEQLFRNVDNMAQFYLAIGATAVFEMDGNVDSLLPDFNTEEGQLYNVQNCNNHWILHHVNFDDRSMRFLDSLPGSIPVIKIRQYQNQLARMFQSRYDIDRNSWRYHAAVHVPRQRDAFSCGDFCLAFLQELLKGGLGEMDRLDPLEIPTRRLSIAMELLKKDVNGRSMLAAGPDERSEDRTRKMLILFHRRHQLRSTSNSLKILIDQSSQNDDSSGDVKARKLALETEVRHASAFNTRLPGGEYYVSSGPTLVTLTRIRRCKSGLTQESKRIHLDDETEVCNSGETSAKLPDQHGTPGNLERGRTGRRPRQFHPKNQTPGYEYEADNGVRWKLGGDGRYHRMCVNKSCPFPAREGDTCRACLSGRKPPKWHPKNQKPGYEYHDDDGVRWKLHVNGKRYVRMCANNSCPLLADKNGTCKSCRSGTNPRKSHPRNQSPGYEYEDDEGVRWKLGSDKAYCKMCSNKPCPLLALKGGDKCNSCRSGRKPNKKHPTNCNAGDEYEDYEGLRWKLTDGICWVQICCYEKCNNKSRTFNMCRSHLRKCGIGVYPGDESMIYLLRWLNLSKIAAGVVCNMTILEDLEQAAIQHLELEGCTDRFLKRAGWTPDTGNVIPLCMAPASKRFHFKFYARTMLGGGISTLTRPRVNTLTQMDQQVVNNAILANLNNLPKPTLYKMSKLDFWKSNAIFQTYINGVDGMRSMRKSDIVAIQTDVDNTIREGAYENAEEDEDEDEEDTNDYWVYVMRWINLNSYPADVVCNMTILEDLEKAAIQHVALGRCTDRFLKRAGWTPDTGNVIPLCMATASKRCHFKFYARTMLGGGISTFTRSRVNTLTWEDKEVVHRAIVAKLTELPDPTLYRMSQMDHWKEDEKFQLFWNTRRQRLVKSEILSILKDTEDTIRSGAWAQAEEEEDCENSD